MWEGYKLTVKGRVSVENKRYDVEIFPLYSSYTGGTGKELQVDSRQNVLRNPKLWLLAVGVVLLFCWGVYTILGFFNGTRAKAEASDSARPAAAPSQAGPGGSLKTNSAQVESSSVSTSWRLVGTVQTKDKQFIVIESQDGRIRLEHPSAFMNTGAVMVGDVDGQRVTAWSGARPATGGRP